MLTAGTYLNRERGRERVCVCVSLRARERGGGGGRERLRVFSRENQSMDQSGPTSNEMYLKDGYSNQATPVSSLLQALLISILLQTVKVEIVAGYNYKDSRKYGQRHLLHARIRDCGPRKVF